MLKSYMYSVHVCAFLVPLDNCLDHATATLHLLSAPTFMMSMLLSYMNALVVLVRWWTLGGKHE